MASQRASSVILTYWPTGKFGVETSRTNHGVQIHVSKEAIWPECSADLIYCNPPCAPWSTAGTRPVSLGVAPRDYSRGFDPRDARVSCFTQCFDQLERVRPTVLVVESVQQAWTKGRVFVDSQLSRAKALGYGTSILLHDGFDCGLPTHRRRVFFVAHKVALQGVVRPETSGPRTVREALAVMAGEDPGTRLRDTYDRLYKGPQLSPVRGRPGFLHRRLEWDKPCPVTTGGCTLYHPDENRSISVREVALLCGYPKDYSLVGSVSSCYAQLAKAVTPPCGAWIASLISKSLSLGYPVINVNRTHVYDLEGKRRDEV